MNNSKEQTMKIDTTLRGLTQTYLIREGHPRDYDKEFFDETGEERGGIFDQDHGEIWVHEGYSETAKLDALAHELAHFIFSRFLGSLGADDESQVEMVGRALVWLCRQNPHLMVVLSQGALKER